MTGISASYVFFIRRGKGVYTCPDFSLDLYLNPNTHQDEKDLDPGLSDLRRDASAGAGFT